MKSVIGYHYTTPKSYKSMKTKGLEGYITNKFDEFSGLIPSRRFIRLDRGQNLPEKAYDSVFEGLLEPEPESWLKNPEFPGLWKYLMGDIFREDQIMLLSFEFNETDDAYVVERAHIERELYKEAMGFGKSTEESMNDACSDYWNSRISILEYKGGFNTPQLAVWSGIEYGRLNVEWIKPAQPMWEKIIKDFEKTRKEFLSNQ